MKKIHFNTKSLAIVVVFIILGVFLAQYYQFTLNSSSTINTNAKSYLSKIHREASAEVEYAYKFAGENITETLNRLDFTNFAYQAQVALASSNSSRRGTLLEAKGTFFVLNPNAATSIGFILSDYLKPFEFETDNALREFENEYSLNHEALLRYHDSKEDVYYYVYYAANSTPIDIFIIADAAFIDNSLIPMRDAASKYASFITTLGLIFTLWLLLSHLYNILHNKRAREAVESAQRRYKTVLIGSRNYIWEYFPDTDSMLWDEANSRKEILLDVSGKNRKEAINQGIVHPDDQWTYFQFCDDLLNEEPQVSTEIRIRADEDGYRWYRLSGSKVFSAEGYPTSVIGQTVDIHESKLENEALREQAAQDSLTKLYNYTSFSEMATKQIESNESTNIMALLLIDVDDFNDLNEAFGYVFADAILVDVAGRIRKIFPENALLGRFGGDEFVVFLNNIPSMNYLDELAHTFITSTQSVLNSAKTDYRLSCSIGIALYPVDANTYDDLFEKADMALYDAKQRGKGRYSIYNTKMQQLPDDMKRKNNTKLSMPSASSKEHSIVDSTILVNAIDILFDSKDLDFSISMMLSIIGIYFKLDHLTIVQFSESTGKATVSHEWSADGAYSIPAEVKITPRDQSSLFKGYESLTNSCFVCDDVNYLAGDTYKANDPYLAGVRALIQYGIRYKDEFTGYINISSSEPRDWSKPETDSLTLLAKLIGSYLVQLRSQETIEYVSQIDSLTGTYNFNTFLKKAEQVISANDSKKFATIYADLMQFKLINDTYGYAVGDQILNCIAEILQSVGGQNSLVARVTGDRFVALYPFSDDLDLLEKVRSIIFKTKRIPQANGDFYKLIAMVGIYLIEPGDSVLVAVDRANIARKNVVDYHICSYMFYKDSMHENLIEQHEIEDTMEDALENEEFVVYYQPKIDMNTLKPIGAEALVRWQRPDGIVPPNKFIPIFEENGFVTKLDYYVLDKVCECIRRHLDLGEQVFPVSVNFSRVHLNNVALPTMIDVTMKRYNIPSILIEVEITESALNASSVYQTKILNEIHDLGCRLSMDDFGSGMSSLNLLRELPFDVLKIDKDFLHNKVMTTKERIVIKNVVRMATELNMEVICEGVETEEQASFLKEIGCYHAQGYLYSKPITEEEFVEKYKTNKK